MNPLSPAITAESLPIAPDAILTLALVLVAVVKLYVVYRIVGY